MMDDIVKGYKVFRPDWTCRGFQYEVGKEYFCDQSIELCRAGFHFCEVASDCFSYYSFNPDNKVAEVEASGITITRNDKSVTDHIRIVREIPWKELLTIVNTGKQCTGLGNTGDVNTGSYNTGKFNMGIRNTGDWNRGSYNTGRWNTGGFNVGCHNIGGFNTGRMNTGSYNVGNCNAGNFNTGSWNSGRNNTGFFNTDEPFVRSFNKPTTMHMEKYMNLKGIVVLENNYENNWWIPSDGMTDEEKEEHPNYEVEGGYLKSIPFKDACRLMWNRMSYCEKMDVKAIPNFDAKIFYDITGIDVGND